MVGAKFANPITQKNLDITPKGIVMLVIAMVLLVFFLMIGQAGGSWLFEKAKTTSAPLTGAIGEITAPVFGGES